MREPRLLGAGPAPASQIYVTPMSLFGPRIGVERNQLYVIAEQQRYELVEYQSATESFTPYLSGISATSVSFSRDGEWMSYVSLPDRTLWRTRADGGERLRLSPPTISVFYPRWSPDGRSIAFMGSSPATSQQAIYVVSRDGGLPRQVIMGPCDNPTWSADGRSLLYMRGSITPSGRRTDLAVFDLLSGTYVRTPESDGMHSPAWSPDGRFAAAISDGGDEIRLFEFSSAKWKTVARSQSVGNLRWSDDSASIYFQDLFSGPSDPVRRVDLVRGGTEQLTPSHPVTPADVVAFYFSGLTPAGHIFGTLLRNNSDLYAIEVDFGR
jgi:dipeptidyl aminopeptidase/acylaminoacyl peptidase